MRLSLVVFIVSCAAASSALYTTCNGDERSLEELATHVKVDGCKQTYCRLRKKTKVGLTMKFKPTEDVKRVTNTVSAQIAGIPFPFIGTDGSDACPNIFLEDGETKAGCPLKANTEYVYKNVIDVLEFYPRVKVIVHWGLTTPKGDLMCFEVPARITN